MPENNRFDDFFARGRYLVLKNRMYNYRLRKRAIERVLGYDRRGLTLEIGSGISPIMTHGDRILFSELSFVALQTLKHTHRRGLYVVADATCLPFCDGAFDAAVASEVLEHVPNDTGAIAELERTLAPDGTLVVTFPHRQMYFAADDEFVHHCRRYELEDMIAKLRAVNLQEKRVEKILGPLEKLTMAIAIRCFQILDSSGSRGGNEEREAAWPRLIAPVFDVLNRIYAVVAWLDARIVPRSLATVLLVAARKQRAPRDAAIRHGVQ